MKTKKLLIMLGAIFVGLIAILLILNQLGILSFFGIGGLNYVTPFEVEDGQVGVFQSEAYLDLFKNSNEVSFTVGYSFSTDDYNARDSILNANIKYEIFNYFSNRWEIIEDNTYKINVPMDIRGTNSRVSTLGTEVYGDGIPGKFAYVKTGYQAWTRYYSCLEGMTVAEAKILRPLPEGSSTYTYYCLYGGERILDEDYDNDRGDSDYDYFPKLITVGRDYISVDDKLRFRITFTTLSSGVNGLNQNSFNIGVWDVKTELGTYYRFLSNECNEIQIFTYEKTINDYEKLIDCQENLILDKWVLKEGVCLPEKVKFTDISSNMFDTLAECQANIEPPAPPLPPILQFFANIWDWIKSLFENK